MLHDYKETSKVMQATKNRCPTLLLPGQRKQTDRGNVIFKDDNTRY